MFRVYYESMAGQKLYAEFGDLTEDRANALRKEHGGAFKGSMALNAECWSVKRPFANCRVCTVKGELLPPSKRVGCQTCLGRGKVPIPVPLAKHGFRKVVFPSQVVDNREALHFPNDCFATEEPVTSP